MSDKNDCAQELSYLLNEKWKFSPRSEKVRERFVSATLPERERIALKEAVHATCLHTLFKQENRLYVSWDVGPRRMWEICLYE